MILKTGDQEEVKQVRLINATRSRQNTRLICCRKKYENQNLPTKQSLKPSEIEMYIVRKILTSILTKQKSDQRT